MEPIYNQPLWPLLSENVQDALIRAGQTKTYSDGQFIHQRGEGSPGLSVILSGRVRFGVYAEAGTYIQTSVLSAGHCFGEATLFASAPRAYDADALGDTKVIEISKPRFDALLEQSPMFANALLVSLTTRLYEALEFADDLRALSPEARILKLLRRFTQSGGFKENAIPVRQIDIAYALGLSRVSVGKALNALQKQGALNLGYGEITLIEQDA
ncbi:MAG: Crp/Fnr family transcriptional regulator [Pseudomonadota bacterium]